MGQVASAGYCEPLIEAIRDDSPHVAFLVCGCLWATAVLLLTCVGLVTRARAQDKRAVGVARLLVALDRRSTGAERRSVLGGMLTLWMFTVVLFGVAFVGTWQLSPRAWSVSVQRVDATHEPTLAFDASLRVPCDSCAHVAPRASLVDMIGSVANVTCVATSGACEIAAVVTVQKAGGRLVFGSNFSTAEGPGASVFLELGSVAPALSAGNRAGIFTFADSCVTVSKLSVGQHTGPFEVDVHGSYRRRCEGDVFGPRLLCGSGNALGYLPDYANVGFAFDPLSLFVTTDASSSGLPANWVTVTVHLARIELQTALLVFPPWIAAVLALAVAAIGHTFQQFSRARLGTALAVVDAWRTAGAPAMPLSRAIRLGTRIALTIGCSFCVMVYTLLFVMSYEFSPQIPGEPQANGLAWAVKVSTAAVVLGIVTVVLSFAVMIAVALRLSLPPRANAFAERGEAIALLN